MDSEHIRSLNRLIAQANTTVDVHALLTEDQVSCIESLSVGALSECHDKEAKG